MSNEAIRRSTSATLGEIVKGEKQFKEQHGIDIADEDEWQQLKDIVARLEQKWLAKLQDAAE